MSQRKHGTRKVLGGNSTTATGSGDIVFTSITFTDDFRHRKKKSQTSWQGDQISHKSSSQKDQGKWKFK